MILIEINMHPRLLSNARPNWGKEGLFLPPQQSFHFRSHFYYLFIGPGLLRQTSFLISVIILPPSNPPPSFYPFIYASLHVLPLTFAYVCKMHYSAVFLDFKGNIANFRELAARQSPVGSHLNILKQIYR